MWKTFCRMRTKGLFNLDCHVFWLNISEVSEMRNLGKAVNKQRVLVEKRFHLLERHLDQNAKAENMLLIAGSPVWFSARIASRQAYFGANLSGQPVD